MTNKKSQESRMSPSATHPTKSLPMDFWEPRTLEELASEQGVHPIEHLEEVLGQGAQLWGDDAELDSFLATLRQRRRKEG